MGSCSLPPRNVILTASPHSPAAHLPKLGSESGCTMKGRAGITHTFFPPAGPLGCEARKAASAFFRAGESDAEGFSPIMALAETTAPFCAPLSFATSPRRSRTIAHTFARTSG